jgi:hypothetical protein
MKVIVVTIDVAKLILVLGGIGIVVSALCFEIACRRLVRLLGAFTKAFGAFIKLLSEWKK